MPAQQLEQESGLYCGLAGGKEELQERCDSLRPGSLVVLGAGNCFEMQIAAVAPAFFDQNAAQLLNVVRAAAAFFGAHIQPNSRTALQIHASGKIENPAAIPPHRRRKYGQLAEDLGEAKAEIDAKKPAKRRAAQPRIYRARERAIFSVDERHDLFEQHLAVAIGFAAAQSFVARRRVLAQARFA